VTARESFIAWYDGLRGGDPLVGTYGFYFAAFEGSDVWNVASGEPAEVYDMDLRLVRPGDMSGFELRGHCNNARDIVLEWWGPLSYHDKASWGLEIPSWLKLARHL